jgi:hypothetical protein
MLNSVVWILFLSVIDGDALLRGPSRALGTETVCSVPHPSPFEANAFLHASTRTSLYAEDRLVRLTEPKWQVFLTKLSRALKDNREHIN